MLSIWAVPGPSSGCFMMTKVFGNTRLLKLANSRSLSPLSFVSSLQKGPQMTCQFPQASLPTVAFQSPCTKMMCFSGVWSMTFHNWWRWGLRLYYCDVERDCPQADGDEPAEDRATFLYSVHDVLMNKKSRPCLCLSSFPLKKTLCSSSFVVSPKSFHLISQSPRMFYL